MQRAVVELPHLITVEEVAEIFGVKPQAIYDMVYKGQLPYTKIGGRLRFDPDKIEEFIKNNSHVPDNRVIDFSDAIE